MCILGPSSALLKMELIDLDLQGHFGLKRVNFHKFELVCAITQQGFDLESPSSHRMCILGPSSALLKMELIDLDLQGHFGLKRVNFHKFELVCAITQQGFDLESPSSHRMCILGPSSALLKMELIDLDLQGHFGLKRVNFHKFELVCAITQQGFDLESPSSHRMCILGPFSALLKMGLIDLDLQGHFGLKRVNFRKFELVCAITRQGFDLETPSSHRMCILGPFSALLKMGLIDLDLQGHFGLKRVNFRKFELVCAITRQGFDLETSSSHRMCILGPFSALLKMGLIDLDLQGHFGLKRVHFRNFELVCAITRQGFDLDTSSSHRMCILGPFSALLKMGLIDLDLQGHFGLKLTDFRKFELVRMITRQGFD